MTPVISIRTLVSRAVCMIDGESENLKIIEPASASLTLAGFWEKEMSAIVELESSKQIMLTRVLITLMD
jgi:hypothetical protein